MATDATEPTAAAQHEPIDIHTTAGNGSKACVIARTHSGTTKASVDVLIGVASAS